MIIFANDVIIYGSIHNVSDFMLLQSDVDSVSDWIKNNLLNLNIQKSKQMIITRKKHPVPSVIMILNGKPLELVSSYRYLGVWITSDLSWTKQIEENCKKANQKIEVVYRRFCQ